jgi:hypothetical protein
MSETQPRPSILFWALVLGGAGFAAGFFGPIVLRPDANQGPLVGLFITGPGGFVLGLALGVLFRFLPVSNARRSQALTAATVALVVGTLISCLPPPETQGMLLEGLITHCESPADLSADSMAHWEQRVANVHWASPRAGWKEDVSRMLREDTGVVLTLDVRRQNRVQKHRKPWNSGRIDAAGWEDVAYSRRYFAEFNGAYCAEYPSEPPTLYMTYGQSSKAWPPDELSNFLNLARVEEAPGRFLFLAK